MWLWTINGILSADCFLYFWKLTWSAVGLIHQEAKVSMNGVDYWLVNWVHRWHHSMLIRIFKVGITNVFACRYIWNFLSDWVFLVTGWLLHACTKLLGRLSYFLEKKSHGLLIYRACDTILSLFSNRCAFFFLYCLFVRFFQCTWSGFDSALFYTLLMWSPLIRLEIFTCWKLRKLKNLHRQLSKHRKNPERASIGGLLPVALSTNSRMQGFSSDLKSALRRQGIAVHF